MGKLTPQEFESYLKELRAFVEGPCEEMQADIEVTNKFPQEFYDQCNEHNIYRMSLPEECACICTSPRT